MALIGVAIYSTPENKKDDCLEKTLLCLGETVDFDKHELGISVNYNTRRTLDIIDEFSDIISYKFFNNDNIGTAKAINRVWALRKPKQYLIKMDDDVDILSNGWVDDLEEAIERIPDKLGICSLKRKDLEERPDHENNWYKSELIMLPHISGQRWYVVEKVMHTMGTCQMYNWRLIDKIGALVQMEGVYGFDDSLSAVRCEKAGFFSAFLNGIEINHLDSGGTDYTAWKREYAAEMMDKFQQYKTEYINGTRSIYQPFE